MTIPALLKSAYRKAEENILINSGATANLIDYRTVERLWFKPTRLPQPKAIYNVDGTNNRKGLITHYVDLFVTLGGKTVPQTFYVTNLGDD